MHTDAVNTSGKVQRRSSKSTNIKVRNLTKSFYGEPLYQSFNLDIEGGSFTSIFGPNGCGKSTLLNMVAGLIYFDSGEISFGGKLLSQAKIGYVFQNYRDALLALVN